MLRNARLSPACTTRRLSSSLTSLQAPRRLSPSSLSFHIFFLLLYPHLPVSPFAVFRARSIQRAIIHGDRRSPPALQISSYSFRPTFNCNNAALRSICRQSSVRTPARTPSYVSSSSIRRCRRGRCCRKSQSSRLPSPPVSELISGQTCLLISYTTNAFPVRRNIWLSHKQY